MEKETKKEKDNRILFITIGIILIIAIVIVALIVNGKKEDDVLHGDETLITDKDLTKLNPKDDNELSHSKVFSSYEEFSKYFEDGVLYSSNFELHNYAVVALMYDECSESNLVPTSYKIDGNNITVTVYYDSKCGGCAPTYDYYILELDKSITDANFSIKSHSRNHVSCDPNISYKPIIYLYPEETTKVSVKLGYKDKIRVSYPKYVNGWDVTVKEDGTILYDGKEYYALYWEGSEFDSELTDEGFVIEGKDTAKFLEEKLELLGLNEREINEFIIYWLPKLESNKYNYIRFETNEVIDKYMPLQVTPTPDNIIRVYMVYKPLNKSVLVKEQTIKTPSRSGFTVVEWGGSRID